MSVAAAGDRKRNGERRVRTAVSAEPILCQKGSASGARSDDVLSGRLEPGGDLHKAGRVAGCGGFDRGGLDVGADLEDQLIVARVNDRPC